MFTGLELEVCRGTSPAGKSNLGDLAKPKVYSLHHPNVLPLCWVWYRSSTDATRYTIFTHKSD